MSNKVIDFSTITWGQYLEVQQDIVDIMVDYAKEINKTFYLNELIPRFYPKGYKPNKSKLYSCIIDIYRNINNK